MANKQINELTEIPAMADDDLLLVYDTDEAGSEKTKKVNMSDFGVSGTWTPTAADASSGGNTSTTGSGWYTKIGNQVTVGGYVSNIDSTGLTGWNSLYIQGLPFTVGAGRPSVGSTSMANVTFTNTTSVAGLVCKVAGGTDAIFFVESTNAGVRQNILVSTISDDVSDIDFVLTYFTS